MARAALGDHRRGDDRVEVRVAGRGDVLGDQWDNRPVQAENDQALSENYCASGALLAESRRRRQRGSAPTQGRTTESTSACSRVPSGASNAAATSPATRGEYSIAT